MGDAPSGYGLSQSLEENVLSCGHCWNFNGTCRPAGGAIAKEPL